MASPTSSLTKSPFCPQHLTQFPPLPFLSFTHSLKPIPKKSKSLTSLKRGNFTTVTVKARTLDFSGSFFEGGFGSDDDPPSQPGSGITALEDKEEPQCPPGLRQYETMMVLRPDMSEDERLALTQKYEEVMPCKNLPFLLFVAKSLFACWENVGKGKNFVSLRIENCVDCNGTFGTVVKLKY